MKTVKRTAAIILVAIMLLPLVACKKNRLVGTWEGEYDLLTFQNDGTLLWAERSSSYDTFGFPEVTHYSVNGDLLFIEGEVETIRFQVQGKTLTFYDDREVVTFFKK